MLLTALLGCSPETTTPTEPVLGDPSGCDPLVPEICALPFPSGLFEVEDASMPTGRRLAYGPESLPINDNGHRLSPDLMNDKDGYSTMTPILTWFDDVSLEGTIDHAHLDAYAAADALTVVVDTTTHERVPHFVELDRSVEDDAERVLFLRPVVPLAHGHRYVVGIRGLQRNGGGPVDSSAAFLALRDGEVGTDPDVESRRQLFDEVVFPELEGQGFARDEVQLAWEFGTGSRERVLGGMVAMRDEALAAAEPGIPYTIDTVEDEDCALPGVHIARTVYGRFTSARFTEEDAPGSRLVRDEAGVPVRQGDANPAFIVRIPCSLANEPGTGGRILQYGHGLFGDLEEARTGYLSELADENRWVVLAHNWTGMSIYDVAWITLMLSLTPSDFPGIPDRTQQGLTEWMVGLRLASRELVADETFQFGGRPVIDPALTPVYYGNSQGAILGGALVAVSPDVERGVLGVGGMPYSLLLARSHDFDPFFKVLKEVYEDGRDIALLLAVLQTPWDPGESGGYASALADPLPGTPSKRLLLQVAEGDAQVTTLGAQLAARAYGAVTLDEANREIWGVPSVVGPVDEGSAIVEWRYTDGAEEPFENLPPSTDGDTHECPRREARAQEQLTTFLESGTIVQTCLDGPCVGTRAGLCD